MRYNAIILLCCFFSCTTPEERKKDTILQNFKKVDSSLQKTNEAMDESNTSEGVWTLDKAALAQLARTDSFLVTAIEEMERSDPSGERLNVAEKMLFKTPRGKELYTGMLEVYAIGKVYSSTAEQKKFFEEAAQPAPRGENLGPEEAWQQAYFKSVPTVVARTLMQKFRNDVRQVEKLIYQSWKFS
jgi:hypothetical protein